MRTRLSILAALLIGLALKAWLVASDAIPFNSDEAIVALMARHILQGERPIFFYGQAYMGSLDAWLIAAAFRLMGVSVWVIRLVQTVLYGGTILSSAWLARLIFGSGKHAVLTAWLLAIPTVNVTLYTTATLGGYGEALLIGNLILGLAILLGRGLPRKSVQMWAFAFLWGSLVGLGVWAFGLSLVYSLPAGLYLLMMLGRQAVKMASPRWFFKNLGSLALLAGSGALLGSLPWWRFAWQNGFGLLIRELTGGAIAGLEGLPFLPQIWQHLVNFLLLGIPVILGMRPPWGVAWLGLPLLPLVLFFWSALFFLLLRETLRRRLGTEKALLLGVCLTVGLGFVFSPFGADPSGRYFLPLAIPMALFAADLVVRAYVRFGRWAWSLVGLLILYQAWGTLQCAARVPPGLTTQFNPVTQVDQRYLPELITFLEQHGERYGYTNYWVAYPLAFSSKEALLFIPVLPYHTDFRYTNRDNRYAPYQAAVDKTNKTAWITSNHPDLDAYLRQQFSSRGIVWQEAAIGDFQVFYALSQQVTALELGLGLPGP